MDTKWKNTAKPAEGKVGLDKNVILGAVLAIAGAAILWFLLGKDFYLSTERTWLIGISADVLLAPAVYLLLSAGLKYQYKNWMPENGDYYEEWKTKWKSQQRLMLAMGIPLLTAAYVFFNNQSYYYWNLARGYFLFFSVLLLYAVCQFCVIRFMLGRLSMMMEKVTEINKVRLAEAIEIERQSLEKAAKSEQLKVDLISNVSHDLKTPLTSMVGYLELLKKEELSDAPRDYVEVISDKAEKLKEMIESLFSLAKASSGNIQIHLEPVELNMLIEQIFADLSDRVETSGLHFVKSLTEEDTHLMTDNLHMYRICQNLIENALKYSAKGTRVFLKTYFAEDRFERRLFFEITNTAGYFMDFNKEDIIERFARGDKARSSDGNGLGLAIVSTYAGALGGAFDISVDCDQFKAVLSFPTPVQTDQQTGTETESELS